MFSPDRVIQRPLPDGTYLELIESLCATRLPATIMTGLFVLVAALATARSGDHALAGISILGVLNSACRLVSMFNGRRHFDAQTMTADAARRFERSFGIFYLGFAAILGAFAARVITLALPDLYMPVSILVVGYAAGVAATMALRPRIAIPSLLLSVTPFGIAIACQTTSESVVSAVCLAALLTGGFRSLDRRNQSQSAGATTREASVQLARRDHLTGLGNRLALTENFVALRRHNFSTGQVAVHYIDLDNFKPINDQLGHLIGDALLKNVADRLLSQLKNNDIAVRIGGDEFVFIQSGVSSPSEVVERAIHLEAVLGTPVQLNGGLLVVGASVGSSGPWPVDTSLEMMLHQSDEALRIRKAQRKGQVRSIPATNLERALSVIQA